MIFFIIVFAPMAFVIWLTWQTIVITARFIGFGLKCASVKRKDPELYRHMKYQGARIMNGYRSPYWMIRHYRRSR